VIANDLIIGLGAGLCAGLIIGVGVGIAAGLSMEKSRIRRLILASVAHDLRIEDRQGTSLPTNTLLVRLGLVPNKLRQ
jgi:hypothetical protein